MTAPVVMSGAAMQFVMPAKYTSMEQLPTPTNPAVRLKCVVCVLSSWGGGAFVGCLLASLRLPSLATHISSHPQQPHNPTAFRPSLHLKTTLFDVLSCGLNKIFIFFPSINVWYPTHRPNTNNPTTQKQGGARPQRRGAQVLRVRGDLHREEDRSAIIERATAYNPASPSNPHYIPS